MTLRVQTPSARADASADEVAAVAAALYALVRAASVATPELPSRWRAAGRVYGGEAAP